MGREREAGEALQDAARGALRVPRTGDGSAHDPVAEREVGGTVPAMAARRGLPARRVAASSEEGPRPGGPAGEVDEAALGLAHRIVELAADKKASDIVLLDVRGQTSMTDYFVICSGASDRQLAAISEGIVTGTKEAGLAPLGREGDAASHWLLLDYGAIIVHVMSGPERDYYQLEKLWAEAALLLHLQ